MIFGADFNMPLGSETYGQANAKLDEIKVLGNLEDAFKDTQNPPMTYYPRDSTKKASRIDGLFLSPCFLSNEDEWSVKMCDLGISDHHFISLKAINSKQGKQPSRLFENSFLNQKAVMETCIKETLIEHSSLNVNNGGYLGSSFLKTLDTKELQHSEFKGGTTKIMEHIISEIIKIQNEFSANQQKEERETLKEVMGNLSKLENVKRQLDRDERNEMNRLKAKVTETRLNFNEPDLS